MEKPFDHLEVADWRQQAEQALEQMQVADDAEKIKRRGLRWASGFAVCLPIAAKRMWATIGDEDDKHPNGRPSPLGDNRRYTSKPSEVDTGGDRRPRTRHG